ncbi:uncharacterized protein ACB057_002165 [Neosynchiropus ocellatus]
MLDVLIIGGGPHALTLATLLSHPDEGQDSLCTTNSSGPQPSCSKRHSGRRKKRIQSSEVSSPLEGRAHSPRVKPQLSLRVVDSYGVWTTLWQSQFQALSIPHLRSHTLIHTDPLNKKSLQEFIVKHKRSAELHSLPDQVFILDENAFFNDMRLGKKEQRRLNVSSTLKKSLSFSLPGTELCVDFFKNQVERYDLNKLLMKGTVLSITPLIDDPGACEAEPEVCSDSTSKRELGTKKKVSRFQVKLHDGSLLEARRVVMATGPTRAQMANIPSWVLSIGESYPEERLQHTVQLMHQLTQQDSGEPKPQTQGQRVMVVGGGLTSAHVVSLALQQGASHVTWVMRKYLQLKQFDVGDVESLVGRYSHVEHGIKMDGQAFLRQFYNERSLRKRLAMIRQARKGGAVTPEAYIQIQPFILNGQVDLKPYCQVSEASWCYKGQTWSLSLSTGHHWTGDMIWLATGCKLDVQQDPLLSEVMKEFPIQVMDGWPCISESLQWAEGCPLYLMGQYTALQVGPHAVNLAGGQAASVRIAKDILSHRRQPTDEEAPEHIRGKSKTEEYIQQMRGMLWL